MIRIECFFFQCLRLFTHRSGIRKFYKFRYTIKRLKNKASKDLIEICKCEAITNAQLYIFQRKSHFSKQDYNVA